MIDPTTYDESKLFPPIVAVDFDGTLVTNKYPYLGEPIVPVIEAIKRLRDCGWKTILWTCRTGDQLDEAIGFCKSFGLEFDEVNRNLPEVREYFGGDTRKVFANIYVDDKSARLIQEPGGDAFVIIPVVERGI